MRTHYNHCFISWSLFNTFRAVSFAFLASVTSIASGIKVDVKVCLPDEFPDPRNATQRGVSTTLWYFFVHVRDNSIHNSHSFQQQNTCNVWALPRKCVQFSSCLDHFQHVFVSTTPLYCNPPLRIRCSFHTVIACLSHVVSSVEEAPRIYQKTENYN